MDLNVASGSAHARRRIDIVDEAARNRLISQIELMFVRCLPREIERAAGLCAHESCHAVTSGASPATTKYKGKCPQTTGAHCRRLKNALGWRMKSSFSATTVSDISQSKPRPPDLRRQAVLLEGCSAELDGFLQRVNLPGFEPIDNGLVDRQEAGQVEIGSIRNQPIAAAGAHGVNQRQSSKTRLWLS
jgi:hypothetical protein